MFKKMKLGQKLILLFLLIGLLPMVTTAIVLYTLTSNSLTEEVEKTLEMFVAETEKSFDERLSSHQENAKLIAQMKDLNAGLTAYYEAQISNYWDYSNEKESLLLFLQDLKREYQYNDLMITDKEGRVICATNNNLSSADLKNQDYIQTTLSGKATNSTLFYSTELSEVVMIMASPIFSKIRQTEVIGVLGLFLDVDRIEELVLDGLDLVGKTADAYLIDQNQTLLTEPKVSQGFEILKTRIDTAGAKLLASAVRNRDDNYREFEVFHDYLGDKCLACLSVFNLGDHPVGFMMEIDYDEAYAAVKEMQTYAIALAGVIFILVIIIGLMFSRSISVPILKINEKLKLIAGGDFTVKLESKRSDEIGEMTDELNLTVEEISNVIYQIIVSAEKVHQASEEISSGNQDLSQRTQEQAATLEEITSTMEEVSSSIQQVAGNTEQADQISKATIAVVQEGEESIQETLGAMGQISASSRQIADIIKVVNDIAFQTNLLALNAAVEAARAGEQGRGFAVVAAEVRNLAGRTAESAKEIEQLINESVDRVTKGHEMVKKSADILGEIVDNTKRTSDVIIEVAAAMREESSALQQIEASTEQLNQVTQQNAAMVEEMTSSSQLLNAEAENLRSMVEQFKINEKEHWTQRSVNNPQVKKEDKIKESSLLKSDDTTLAGFKQDSLKKF